jgi:uncharacterized protein
MSPIVVRYAQVAPTPWKNGCGATSQLAVHPAEASLESFDFRISIARLDISAPFSVFPGVERWLALLAGEIMLLREGFEPSRLTTRSEPIHFAGEVNTIGEVIHAPVLDLNVMYRANRWRATMRRVVAMDQVFALAPPGFVCSCSTLLCVELPESHVELGLFDLLEVTERCDVRLVATRGVQAEAHLVQLQAS